VLVFRSHLACALWNRLYNIFSVSKSGPYPALEQNLVHYAASRVPRQPRVHFSYSDEVDLTITIGRPQIKVDSNRMNSIFQMIALATKRHQTPSPLVCKKSTRASATQRTSKKRTRTKSTRTDDSSDTESSCARGRLK
jgi:hypothetical protein